MSALDCPDGLARCAGGIVEASRLARVPQPCTGSPEACTCPWERLGDCEKGCVVEGLEVVVDRSSALPQLCAPSPDSGTLARIATTPQAADCDDDVAYRCAARDVVDCTEHRVVGSCMRGCFAEDADLPRGDVLIDREAAFAILCSR